MSNRFEKRCLSAHGHLQLFDHSGVKSGRLDLRIRVPEIGGDLVTVKGLTRHEQKHRICSCPSAQQRNRSWGQIRGRSLPSPSCPFHYLVGIEVKQWYSSFRKSAVLRVELSLRATGEKGPTSLGTVFTIESTTAKTDEHRTTIMNSYSVCLLQSASTQLYLRFLIDRLRIGASYRSVVESGGWYSSLCGVSVIGSPTEYIYTNDLILRPFRISDYPSSWFVNDQVIQGMAYADE